MIEDEMVGWHHHLDGHEFEQTLGVGDGQKNLNKFLGQSSICLQFSSVLSLSRV